MGRIIFRRVIFLTTSAFSRANQTSTAPCSGSKARRACLRRTRGRQQTLEATIDWSHDLLSIEAQVEATVRACGELVKPGGWVFFATINRNPKSYLFAIIGAEYLLKLLPRGTHDYAKLIKPSELATLCRSAGLSVSGITGMTYNPLTRVYALGHDTDVNYILHCHADERADDAQRSR